MSLARSLSTRAQTTSGGAPLPATTQAAVLRGGTVSIEHPAVSEPGAGEVLVAVDLATVCGADRAAAASGEGPDRILGHEGVGRVVRAGSGVALRQGARVVWSPVVTCGRCDRCRAGLSAACRKSRALGREPIDGSWPLSGSFARHLLLPRGTAIAAVPDALADPVAASAGCAAATVVSAFDRAGSLPGARVLILGAGLLGLTAAAYANDHGAASIAVLDRDAARRTLARKFGATETIDHSSALPDTDIAIDLTRTPETTAAALHSLTVGGRMVLVEQHRAHTPGDEDPTRVLLDAHRTTARWQSIVGVSGAEPRHLIEAIEYLTSARTRWPWEQLVTPAVPISHLPTLLAQPAPIAPRTAVQPRR